MDLNQDATERGRTPAAYRLFASAFYFVAGIAAAVLSWRLYGFSPGSLAHTGALFLSALWIFRVDSSKIIEKLLFGTAFVVQCFLSLFADWRGVWLVFFGNEWGSVAGRVVHFEERGPTEFALDTLAVVCTAVNVASLFWALKVRRRGALPSIDSLQ
jgi:hypothetical protein